MNIEIFDSLIFWLVHWYHLIYVFLYYLAYYLVDYLLSCGANINCKDSDDNTPLHLSAKLGYEKITLYLLCKNANYQIKNKYNEYPSAISCNYSIYKVINKRKKI